MSMSDWLDLVAVLSLLANVGLAVGWLSASRRVLRLEERRNAMDDPRVGELQQAVIALSDQVEALTSGQEFLDRLVTSRLSRLPEVTPSRGIDRPHERPITPLS